MPTSIAHHFVPQHLQRNFANKPEDSLSVFDVQDAKTFETGSSVIMQRGHFHTIIGPGGRANVEAAVTAIEGQVLATLKDVVEHKRLAKTEEESRNLSLLVAFQELRTSRFRNQIVRLSAELSRHAEKLGADPVEVERWLPPDHNLIAATHIRFMFEHVEGFARIIMPRTFHLAAPPEGRSLYLGDSPVVRHNDEPQTYFSNHGFAAKGLQIYMPLASDLMFGIWDTELIERFQENLAEARRLKARYTLSPTAQINVSRAPDGANTLESFLAITKANKARLECIEEGRPIALLHENVDFYNSLQLGASERHVVCPYGDYELAQRWFRGRT